jgi:hypothetical protein
MLLKKNIKVYPQIINFKTISCLIRHANKSAFEKAGIGTTNVKDDKIRKVLRYVLSPQSKFFN